MQPTTTNQREPQTALWRFLALLLTVVGLVGSTAGSASAFTATPTVSSSDHSVVVGAETRVGVTTQNLVGSSAHLASESPACVGEIGSMYDIFVSVSCVATKTVPCASFRADTLVLMADGSKKPISEIEVGDKVVATDPVTGKTSVRTVTRLFTHIDDDLLDLVVLTDDGVETIHTTEHHRFWNDTTKTWVEAKDLKSGERLLASDGDVVTVGELKPVSGAAPMLDLTVDTDHTFYVALTATSVLVHNQNCGYVDITKGKSSVRNIQTDITRADFESTLQSNGWSKAVSKDGVSTVYSKDGATYAIRNKADSSLFPTADFTPAGAPKPTLKIRIAG
jgi:Pretoxin HINT domain